jgi:hypothetical protein
MMYAYNTIKCNRKVLYITLYNYVTWQASETCNNQDNMTAGQQDSRTGQHNSRMAGWQDSRTAEQQDNRTTGQQDGRTEDNRTTGQQGRTTGQQDNRTYLAFYTCLVNEHRHDIMILFTHCVMIKKGVHKGQ